MLHLERPDAEGTWTPVLTFVVPGDLSVSYTTQLGTWSRIGSVVTLWLVVITSAFTHTTASGNLRITGSPFTARNNGMNLPGAAAVAGITKASYTSFASFIVANTAILNITASGSAQALSNVAAADMPTAGSVVIRGAISFLI